MSDLSESFAAKSRPVFPQMAHNPRFEALKTKAHPYAGNQRRLGDTAALEETQRKSAWLVTFTDAMALMLTFFVLLFAMAEPEDDYWTDMTSALQQEFSVAFGPRFDSGPVESLSLGRVDFRKALDLNYLRVVLEETFEQNESLQNAVVTETDEAIIVSFPADLLFDAGSSVVKDSATSVLSEMTNLLSQLKNQVVLHGHADPVPMSGQGQTYSTNWGLSLVRAASVAKALNDLGYERSFMIRGYGDSQYNLIPENLDRNTRLSLSRRVDVLILEDDGTTIDPL